MHQALLLAKSHRFDATLNLLVRCDAAIVREMAKPSQAVDDFDSPWKEALQRYLRSFLAFFFTDIEADVDWSRDYESLDKEFQQIIQDAAASGTGVLLVSSDLDELARACDRVLILRQGRVVAEAIGDDLDRHRLEEMVYTSASTT